MFCVMVGRGEESELSKSNSNFKGSFGVCDSEYRFNDSGGWKGNLVRSTLEWAGVLIFVNRIPFVGVVYCSPQTLWI